MRTDGEAKSKDTSKSYFQGYQSVLHSKSSEETLVLISKLTNIRYNSLYSATKNCLTSPEKVVKKTPIFSI